MPKLIFLLSTGSNAFKMKNTIFIVIIAGFLFSCSSDDEVKSDPLIGFWNPFQVGLVLADGTTRVEALPECEQGASMRIHKNGQFGLSIYAQLNEEEDCLRRIETMDGSWDKVTENNYAIYFWFYYDDEDYNAVLEEGEANFSLDVSFPEKDILHVYDQELLGFYPEAVLAEDVESFYIIYRDESW